MIGSHIYFLYYINNYLINRCLHKEIIIQRLQNVSIKPQLQNRSDDYMKNGSLDAVKDKSIKM